MQTAKSPVPACAASGGAAGAWHAPPCPRSQAGPHTGVHAARVAGGGGRMCREQSVCVKQCSISVRACLYAFFKRHAPPYLRSQAGPHTGVHVASVAGGCGRTCREQSVYCLHVYQCFCKVDIPYRSILKHGFPTFRIR